MSFALGLVVSMGVQHCDAALEKVPGGVFFRTSPLSPDEKIEEFQGYAIAEVSVSGNVQVIETDKNGGKLYEMEIWIRKAPDYIMDTLKAKTPFKGIYKVFINDLKPVVVFGRGRPSEIRDEEFDFSEILYCLIRKTDEGKLQLYRKLFRRHDRF